MNLESIFVYDNNELFLFIFKNIKDKKILVHEDRIMKFKFEQLISGKKSLDLKETISYSYDKVMKIFKLEKKEINLYISPDKYYFTPQSGKLSFDEPTIVNDDDIKRTVKSIKNSSIVEKDYKVVDFIIKEKSIDNEYVNKLSGEKASSIELQGDLVVADEKMVIIFQELFTGLGFKINKIKILDYYLKEALQENGDLVISIEKTKIRFLSMTGNRIINFDFAIGSIGLLEKIYEILEEKYGNIAAEKITRVIQKTWNLETYSYKYDIINETSINSIIDIVVGVVYQYFKYVFGEARKQKIHVSRIKFISNEMQQNDFVKFIQNNFSYQCEILLDKDFFVSSLMSHKLNYIFKKIENDMK